MSNSNPVLAIAVIGVLALIGSEAHAGQAAGSAQTRQSAQRTSMQKSPVRTLMQKVTPARQAALEPLQLQTRQLPAVRPTSTPSHGGWGPWEKTHTIRAAGTDSIKHNQQSSSSRLPNPKWNDIVLKRGRVADQTDTADSLATSGADEPVQASGPMEVLSWTWGVDGPVSAVHGEPASSQRYADLPPASAQTTGDRAFRSRTGHVMTQDRQGGWIEVTTVSLSVPAGVPVETLDIAHEGFLDEKPSAAEDTGPEEDVGFVFQQIKLKQDANTAANATDDLKATKSDLLANGQKEKEAGNDVAVESMTIVHESIEKPTNEIDPASVAWVSGKGGTR